MNDTLQRYTTLERQIWTACRIMSIGPETVTFETEGSSAHLITVTRTDVFPDARDMELAGDRVYDVDILPDRTVTIEHT